MSFVTSTVKCKDCAYEMNVALGVVGRSTIAEWPKDCSMCKGPIEKISDGWNANNKDWKTVPKDNSSTS